MLAVGRGQPSTGASRQQHPAQDRLPVDGAACHRSHGCDDLFVEARGDAGIVEGELLPVEREDTGDDRTAGDARYPGESVQVAGFVQAPQGAEVKQHRPVAAAREAEGDPLLRVALGPVARGCGRMFLHGGSRSFEIDLTRVLGHSTENSTHNG